MPAEDSLSKIRLDGASNCDNNYMDLRFHVDLGQNQSRELKSYAFPIPLKCFLPYSWDNLPAQEREGDSFEEFLALPGMLKPIRENKTENALWQQMVDDLIPLNGSYTTVPYQVVEDQLRDASALKGILPEDPAIELVKNGPVLMPPLKLFIAAVAYQQFELDNPEARDLFSLLFDKIALVTLLPIIFEMWPKKVDVDAVEPGNEGALPSESQFLQKFDILMAKSLMNLHLTSQPTHMKLFTSDNNLKIRSVDWKLLVTLTVGPTVEKPSYVLYPIEDLDQLLSDHLRDRFPAFRKMLDVYPEKVETWKEIEREIEKFKSHDAASDRRIDHAFFYPIIDRLFQATSFKRNHLDLLKLRYRKSKDIELPVIGEVDLRPQFWARQAMMITTEMRIAAKNYSNAKANFDKNIEKNAAEFTAVSDELRRATRMWYEAHRQFEMLKQQVSNQGWELTLLPEVNLADAKNPPLDDFLNVTFKMVQVDIVTRYVQFRRESLVRWTEWVATRQCKRWLVFERCRTVRIPVERSRLESWYETRTEFIPVTKVLDKQVAIDYDPVATYLKRGIPQNAFGKVEVEADKITGPLEVLDRIRYFASQVGTAPDNAIQVDSGHFKYLLNSQKEVHIFSVCEDGKYRDQHGISLEVLLNDLEKEPSDSASLHPKFRKLFLIPVAERLITGEIETVKYLAVHNPVKGRIANVPPRVFLVETYRNSVGQEPGHWLGALSHVASLFPGETRKMKLATESRVVTQQKTEVNRAQRTSIENSVNVREQLRSEFTRTKQNASQNKWNVEASGGLNLGVVKFGGSGGGGGQSSNSVQEVASTLNDRISEVLNTISNSNEVQFMTSSELTETRATSTEQIVEFSNVNQGRAVNYKFFQILNKHISKIFLEDVKIVVEYGDELIPGLNLVRTDVYPIDQIHRILPQIIEEDRQEILLALKSHLKDRYGDSLQYDNETGTVPIRVKKGKDAVSIRTSEFFVNSGAFFVETQVSNLPATEEYVNEAREAEIKHQLARAARLDAEAEALRRGIRLLPNQVENLYIRLTDNVRSGEGDGS